MAITVRRNSILNFACATALSVATLFAPAHAASEGKKRADDKPAATQSLEARHEKCLAFIRRHDLTCDPWVEPTCGGDFGYFRPPECVRPRPK